MAKARKIGINGSGFPFNLSKNGQLLKT